MRSTKVDKSAVVAQVERYSPERKAEFLLNNAVDDADYRKAQKEVRKLGVNRIRSHICDLPRLWAFQLDFMRCFDCHASTKCSPASDGQLRRTGVSALGRIATRQLAKPMFQ
jgi:hypothetical protein